VSAAPPRALLWLVLGAAVLGISSSAVLVRGMDAAPLAVAAWRTTGAALLLSPAWVPALPRLDRRTAVLSLAAGLALGLHFAVWFESLQRTTVLRSTLLVCTTPVWAGLMDAALARRAPPGRFLAGVGLALVGVAVMAGVGGGSGAASADGDALAVLGAVLAATYLRCSQEVRQVLGAGATMGVVCACASAATWCAAIGSGAPMSGYPTTTWALLVAAVLGPQLVGHQGFTWAVRWLPARVVATVILLEPVGAALLAAIFLGEVPPWQAWLGAVAVLAGVGWAAR
jgi:drug/metabolite transporter (DMT)-like permease